MTASSLTAAVRAAGVYRVTGALHPGGMVSVTVHLRDVEGAPCALTGEAASIEDAVRNALAKVQA